MRPTVGLVAAALGSVAALVVIAGLIAHARTGRVNDDKIDDARTMLGSLQTLPWTLRSATVVDASAVRTRMRSTERDITQTIGELKRRAPVQQLTAVSGPLTENFAAINRVEEMLAADELAQAAKLMPAAFVTDDRAIAVLNRASDEYRDQTNTALLEATIGSVLVVLLLLSGFGFMYLRALRARAASDALAGDLRRSETHLEQAQRIAGVGSFEWDLDGRILSFSAEHARLHGWTDPEPPRDPAQVLDLVAPADRARVAATLRAAASGAGPVEFDYRLRETYGGRQIHVQAAVVTGSDGRRRMIGTSQDLTDRLREAEIERANQAKNQFISRMSHELRTPLNAVLGFGQLLEMSELDERQHANVDHILAAGRHLLDLINEILDISRIESGDLRISPAPVGIGAVIGDAIDLVTPIAEHHAISVAAASVDAGLWVNADPQRLRQVLLNLLSNAVKYNHEGGNVRVTASATAPHRVEVVVEDDGPGIAPAMLDRLFSPFDRLGAENGAVEGTGLGLAVSRGIVEAMGGRITVRSALGQGTAFTVELEAAADGREPAIESSDGALVASGPAAGPMRVLCIEDNPSNLSLLEQILAARPNVQVLTALSGERGIQLAREQAPELILLDLNLPDLTGEEMLARLKRDPATRELRIVVLSAGMTPPELDRLLALGAGSYLSKPVDVTELLQFVDDPDHALRQAA